MQEQYTGTPAERRAEARNLLSKLKDAPCMDCGGAFPTPAMQFDHRDPSVKSHNVSKFATTGRIEGMLAEIEKCDLVCANCHAARTAEQRRLGLIRSSARPRIDVAASKPGDRRFDTKSARRALSIAMHSRHHSSIQPPAGYESLASAVARYGVSERTLRRRIAEGELEAERLMRPQGSVLFVKLPSDAAPAGDAASPQGSDEAADTRQDAALRILETLLVANAETMERQGEQIAKLTERAARAEAERDAARQAAEAARGEAAELRTENDRLRGRSWWGRLWNR